MSTSAPGGVDAPIRILIADDEASVRDRYREILQPPTTPPAGGLEGIRTRVLGHREPADEETPFSLSFCAGAEQAVQAVHDAKLDERPFSLVFLDMRMPPGPDGAWAATRIRELDPQVDVVIATPYAEIDPEAIARQVPPARSLHFLRKPIHSLEVRQLARALGSRRRAEDRVAQLAYHDEVTGLPNRAFFNSRLNRALGLAWRHRRRMAVMFLGLDHFRCINETFCHSIGDILLRKIAERLLQALRTVDPTDPGQPALQLAGLARFGGDELTLLLPEIGQGQDAAAVARRLLDSLCEPFALDGYEVRVTASIGIGVYPQDGQDAETLLKSADIAMYFAKREGRNRFRFFAEAASAEARPVDRQPIECVLDCSESGDPRQRDIAPAVALTPRTASRVRSR